MMNYELIKAAIFDVDGTILDTMEMWRDAADIYLATLGIKSEEDLNKKFLSATVESVAAYMKKAFNIPLEEIEIQKGIQKVAEDFYRTEAQLKPGILELIQKLNEKNIPMVVASSGIRPLINSAFDRLGITGFFKEIFTGDKNSPELFTQCLKFLGTEARDTFVFEDGIHAIATAEKIGLKTVAVKDIQENYDEIVSLSDYTFDDISLKECNKN